MNYDINPFQVLYVTDSPDPRVFVELFSDLPIRHAAPLFQAGNVVLKGTQGAGKSMLLNLFKPKIRVAYSTVNASFPVKAPNDRFLGAGINFTSSGALDIGQRPLSANPADDETVFPLYFADFLNYFIVRDILNSLIVIRDNAPVFQDLIKASFLDSFAESLSTQGCWFGALNGCSTFHELCGRIDARIAAYRLFHQYNADLPPDISGTKTNIHEPIARTEQCLKESGVIASDTPVFIRIDQIERLYRSDSLRPSLGQQYRRVINKALSKRDSRISYRIGTRRYAWEDDLLLYGTNDRLEDKRDYRIIDLDDMLRRKENRKTWMFPDFAVDALRRRLKFADLAEIESDPLAQVFGETENADDAAKKYCRNAHALAAVKWEQDWPVPWQAHLEALFKDNPYRAVLLAAWARQGGRTQKPGDRLTKPPPARTPWKATWEKDHVRQALMQIASRCAQRLKWAGKDSIINLSAANISIFLSICHEIWDAFLRAEREKPHTKRRDPIAKGIDPNVQAVGIQAASKDWYVKISEQPKGDDRQRFISVLGRLFRKWLLTDAAMSYPGHNGFSLAVDDLRDRPSIRRFLQEAVDFGDLFDAPHTTKEKHRKQRIKWYLSPILSDFFQIPEAHIKEPYYASVLEVEDWLREAGVFLEGVPTDKPNATKPKSKRHSKKDESGAPSLFAHMETSDPELNPRESQD